MRKQDPWPAHYYDGTCGRGHERSVENTFIKRQNGIIKRECRVCKRENPKQLSSNANRDHTALYLRAKVRRGKPLSRDQQILLERGSTVVPPPPAAGAGSRRAIVCCEGEATGIEGEHSPDCRTAR